jgi:hypothetical protein
VGQGSTLAGKATGRGGDSVQPEQYPRDTVGNFGKATEGRGCVLLYARGDTPEERWGLKG